MPTLAQFFQSRTNLYALAIALLSVLQGYVFLFPVKPVEQMFIGLGIAAGIVFFRFLTTQALNSK